MRGPSAKKPNGAIRRRRSESRSGVSSKCMTGFALPQREQGRRSAPGASFPLGPISRSRLIRNEAVGHKLGSRNASTERWNPASGRVGLLFAAENASRGRVPPNATAWIRRLGWGACERQRAEGRPLAGVRGHTNREYITAWGRGFLRNVPGACSGDIYSEHACRKPKARPLDCIRLTNRAVQDSAYSLRVGRVCT